MGNCQAAEVATVLIQRPGGGAADRIYWSVSAREVMTSNPGHYVAMVVAQTAEVRQLKLLRPDDTLRLGQLYRLISFQDVLKEIDAKKKKKKKSVKLGKLLNQSDGGRDSNYGMQGIESESGNSHTNNMSGVGRGGRRNSGQWKPALQTIAECRT